MTIPERFFLFKQNDQYIEWGPLIDGLTRGELPPTYINDATGAVSVLDSNGSPVTGASAIAFTYVPSSNGIYRALITQAFNPTAGTNYKTKVTLSTPGGADGEWEIPTTVMVREN